MAPQKQNNSLANVWQHWTWENRLPPQNNPTSIQFYDEKATNKTMLLDKLFHHSLSKDLLLGYLRNIHISYRHNEKRFIIITTRMQHFGNTRQASEFQNSYGTETSPEQLQFNVDRGTFIRNVLDGLMTNKSQPVTNPKRIVMDFSSPNIAKPFHFGHLRSTIIGNFIANINKHYNNKVTRINYIGDWGTQFGLLQYGLEAKNINIDTLKNNPIKTLYEAYVYANKLSATDENIHQRARKYFADIEQGNTSLENWKRIREFTVQELEKVYQRLGINFDEYHWESDYNGTAIKDLMDKLENTNIISCDETGKRVAKIKDKNITVLKSDNSTLYLSRDIAALLDRYNRYKFDKMLYIVDNAQTDHFTTLFEIVKQINIECTKGCEHIKFGRIKGMSTRSGNVVFLNDILDEAKTKMYEKQQQSKNTRSAAMNENTCDILGTTAVVINDLKQRRQKDYTFTWDRALQSEGDSGIKLQYLHCRLWSLEQNSGASLPEICDPNYMPEEIIGDVVTELARFHDILHRSLVEYEACIVVNYLFHLARHVNRMFNELKVKDVSPDLAAQRLLVFHSARLVLKTGLEILGVKPLFQM